MYTKERTPVDSSTGFELFVTSDLMDPYATNVHDWNEFKHFIQAMDDLKDLAFRSELKRDEYNIDFYLNGEKAGYITLKEGNLVAVPYDYALEAGREQCFPEFTRNGLYQKFIGWWNQPHEIIFSVTEDVMEWMRIKGFDGRNIENPNKKQVKDKIVVGYVPLWIAASAYKVITPTFWRDPRNTTKTTKNATFKSFSVYQVNKEPMMKLEQFRALLNDSEEFKGF